MHPAITDGYLDGSLRPTLTMLEASARAPEMYAVEGVVMRLLAEHPGADVRYVALRGV